jgi:hypothetical protein
MSRLGREHALTGRGSSAGPRSLGSLSRGRTVTGPFDAIVGFRRPDGTIAGASLELTDEDADEIEEVPR